jgi:hypothetical protein
MSVVKINSAIKNLYNNFGIKIPYKIEISQDSSSYGWVDSTNKVIKISSVVLEESKLLEEVILHEFFHLYLQLDTRYMFDILASKYLYLYFIFLNEYVKTYKIVMFPSHLEIMCHFKLTKKIKINISKNILHSKSQFQFDMFSEFIVYNLTYYILDKPSNLDKRIIEMCEEIFSFVKSQA